MTVCGRVLAVGACIALAGAAGCSKKEEERDPVVRAPVERGPSWTMADIDMDYRVQFPEERKPSSKDLAQSIADFASAFAAGDAGAVRPMLADSFAVVLDDLVETGDWTSSTSAIEAVRVCVLEEESDGVVLGLGIQQPGLAYMLAWTGSGGGSGWEYAGMAIDPITAVRVIALDGVDLEEPEIPELAPEPEPEPEEQEDRRPGIGTDSDGAPPPPPPAPPERKPFEKPLPPP